MCRPDNIYTIVGQPLQTGPQLKTCTFYTQSSHFALEKYLVNWWTVDLTTEKDCKVKYVFDK